MHRLIFGHSFVELVALILLPGLAFYFLNKKKASMHGNVEDADTGASPSLISQTGTTSRGSSSSPAETSDGASGLSTASTGDQYDVFLNFRGSDIRESFADHLYYGLNTAGIHAFRDSEKLRQGEEIGPVLSAAIKNSKIMIPIFSEDYGKSKWCLDELVKIMECKNNEMGHIVLPIFYKVAPADVRHQIGKFEDAFLKHQKRYDPIILKKWKQALEDVANLSGWEVKGSEVELVKSVVQRVLFELKKKFEVLIPDHVVGIDSHVKEIMELVKNNSCATLFVGIHGMGGIGKTTLAKIIYKKLSNQFKHRSFIADTRELWKRNGVCNIQNQLLHDILKQEYKVRNEGEGINFLSSMLKGKKILIILDDVDGLNQLKALAGNHNWFSSGSVIIITTRDESILDRACVDHKYEHQGLNKNNSLILFSRHAFRKNAPPPEFKELTDEVLSTTGGLPLSIVVLGSLFCGKEATRWRGKIEKLKKIPEKDVREKLMISYETLENGQKQIFLDIACFFIGADERIAFYMWKACDFFPEDGLEVLRFMSLIKVGEDHRLRMHDQLRDLGRWIVLEENEYQPQNRSRLWESEKAMKMLEENEGSNKIKAISLGKDSLKGLYEMLGQDRGILKGEQFKKLTDLRFLDSRGAYFSGDFKNSFKKLKWLRWQCCPSIFEANNFHVKDLVVLDMENGKISDEWQGWSFIKMAGKLKYLNLRSCLELKKTSFLSAFGNLEVLILKQCYGIEQIDSSIGNMKSLVRLDLSECGNLKGLPAEELGKLQALKELDLCGSSITQLPDSIGDLQNLEILDIGFTRIKELPGGIGRLSKLQRLRTYACHGLQSRENLPLSAVFPSSLTDLELTWRGRRAPSLSNLIHLQVLRLLKCEFREWNGEHPSTPDVSQLSRLKTLSVDYCPAIFEIRGLDKLQCLESLVIGRCHSIEKLDLRNSKRLKKLVVSDCRKLVEIQGLDRLETLVELRIPGCDSLKTLPELPRTQIYRNYEIKLG